MKRIVQLILIVIVFVTGDAKIFAQTLPVGSCGIVYTYDAAGNRTKREYVCNNGFATTKDISVDGEKISAKDIMKVDVLYPNPTTGIFSVKLVKTLNKATVTINDVSGKLVLKKIENGNVLNYDLSQQAAGEYIVIIKEGEKSVNMKVIKQK